MKQINQIAWKSVLPQLLFVIALSFGTVGAGVYVANENAKTADSISRHDKWLVALTAMIMLLLYIDVYVQYKKTEKLSAIVARRYLKKSMNSMPEMKDFDKLLDNPKAMKSIATLISNSLRPSEQKLVNKIASKALADLRKCERSDMEYKELLNASNRIFVNACAHIIKIIQEHASVHPEFIHEVYAAMVNADMMIYIMKKHTHQHTR